MVTVKRRTKPSGSNQRKKIGPFPGGNGVQPEGQIFVLPRKMDTLAVSVRKAEDFLRSAPVEHSATTSNE